MIENPIIISDNNHSTRGYETQVFVLYNEMIENPIIMYDINVKVYDLYS